MEESTPANRYIFGPIASRRLGRSLGIDPVPLKTCNWNCVYCQLGRTSPLEPKRAEYVDADEVLEELRQHLREHGEDSFDWITFVGSGEPTLHARLGWMVREAKRLAKKPVAVITNGALLSDASVRKELLEADAVMPTVSAGTEGTYLRLHRPAHGLDFTSFAEGLVAFRKEYTGKLWAEVMLVTGYNDEEEELLALRELLHRIRPDEIQVVLPTRPPALPSVRPASSARMSLAVKILSAAAPVGTAAPDTEAPTVSAGGGDLLEVILGLVQRHPMTETELVEAMSHWPAEDIRNALTALTKSGRALSVEREGRFFYSSGEARYVDDDVSS